MTACYECGVEVNNPIKDGDRNLCHQCFYLLNPDDVPGTFVQPKPAVAYNRRTGTKYSEVKESQPGLVLIKTTKGKSSLPVTEENVVMVDGNESKEEPTNAQRNRDGYSRKKQRDAGELPRRARHTISDEDMLEVLKLLRPLEPERARRLRWRLEGIREGWHES